MKTKKEKTVYRRTYVVAVVQNSGHNDNAMVELGDGSGSIRCRETRVELVLTGSFAVIETASTVKILGKPLNIEYYGIYYT